MVLIHGHQVPGTPPNPDPGWGGCLAVLRRDGFISLDAGAKKGMLLTRPFKITAGRLFINVDASKGEVGVEVLNRAGNVVARSEPLTGDLLREQVKWAEGNIARMRAQTVSLRFTLSNAQLYSYWLE